MKKKPLPFMDMVWQTTPSARTIRSAHHRRGGGGEVTMKKQRWMSYAIYWYKAHGGGYRSVVFTGPKRNVIVMVTRRYRSKDAAEQAAVDTMRGKRRDEPGWMVGR